MGEGGRTAHPTPTLPASTLGAPQSGLDGATQGPEGASVDAQPSRRRTLVLPWLLGSLCPSGRCAGGAVKASAMPWFGQVGGWGSSSPALHPPPFWLPSFPARRRPAGDGARRVLRGLRSGRPRPRVPEMPARSLGARGLKDPLEGQVSQQPQLTGGPWALRGEGPRFAPAHSRWPTGRRGLEGGTSGLGWEAGGRAGGAPGLGDGSAPPRGSCTHLHPRAHPFTQGPGQAPVALQADHRNVQNGHWRGRGGRAGRLQL